MGHLISFFGGTGNRLDAEENSEARSVAEELIKIGRKIGTDNEALRDLLLKIGRGIGGLDDLKEALANLADPLDQTLRTLERETSDNFGLRAALNELRTSHEALRCEFKELGKKLTAKDAENEQMRGALVLAQQSIEASQVRETELASQLEPARAKLSELESQLARETASVRMLADHKHSFTDRAATANKKIIEMEATIASMREKLVLGCDENRSLQATVKQIVGENSRLSRCLTQSTASFDKARLEIEQTKSALNLAEAEYAKLTAKLDEAYDKYQVQTRTLNARLDATSSRATAADKLLAEQRENLLARTEEVNALQSKLGEAIIARDSRDKKLDLLQNELQAKDRQLLEREQLHLTQVERCDNLEKVGKLTAADLARTAEQNQWLAEQVNRLEAEAEASRVKNEKRTQEFRSELERERLERTVAEGALQKARSNYLDLQRRSDELKKCNSAEKGKASQYPTRKDLSLAQIQWRSMPGDLTPTEGNENSLTCGADTGEMTSARENETT